MKTIWCYFAILVLVCGAKDLDEKVITVRDGHGVQQTSVSLVKYSGDTSLYCSLTGGGSVAWAIQPDVKGVSLSPYGTLHISTDAIIPKTTFNITATSSNVVYSLLFDIEVTGCPYGEFLIIDSQVQINLVLYRESELVFNDTTKSVTLCYPPSTYRYIIEYPYSGTNYAAMMDDKGVYYHHVMLMSSTVVEGTFSNDPTAKPSISFPSIVSLAPRFSKLLFLSSQGPIDRVTIEPKLNFDMKSFQLIVSPSDTPTTYTITAYHGQESVQTSFTAYSGFCPEGYSLITAKFSGLCPRNSYALPDIEGGTIFSMEKTFCTPTDAFNATFFGSGDCYLQFLEDGVPFYQQPAAETLVHFVVNRKNPVAFASPLSYSTDAPKKQWAQVEFDEKGWKKGAEGSWGEAASAWFRAPFKLEKDLSFCLVSLRGMGSVTVFVNGNAFSSTTLTEEGNTLIIPPSYLGDDNVIAVALSQHTPAAIRFGLSVRLSNSPLLQVMQGEASAIQPNPKPARPAEQAFFDGNIKNRFWETDAVPAELIFTFHNDTQQVVNEVRMVRGPIAAPFAFDIVGVSGDERVTLGSYNRDALGESSTYFAFPNLRAFNAIHFVFSASNLTEPIKIHSVLLLSRPLHTCPKKYGFKGVVDGTTLYKRCPLGSTGRKQLSCVHENGETFWSENREQCYSTNPAKEYEFLDWAFTIRGITSEAWKEGRPITEMLAEETYMRGRDVSYMYEDYVAEGEVTVLRVFSRCVLERGMGAVIKRSMERLSPRFSELVSKWTEVECTASIDSVKVRHHVNWAVVISVSVVMVVVVVVIAMYLSFRNKKGDVKRLQKGINVSTADNASLLV